MVSDQCRWISIPAKSNRLFHQSHRPSDIQWCMIGDSNLSFAMQRRNMVRPVSTHLLPSGNYIPCRVSQFLYTINDPERGTLRSISRASGIITTKMRTTRCHLTCGRRCLVGAGPRIPRIPLATKIDRRNAMLVCRSACCRGRY